MIPEEIRQDMSEDQFMRVCIHYYLGNSCECNGRVEWEHAMYYKGKKIQEAWAIVPCCTYHHRDKGLNKEYNQYIAIIRADIDDLERRMPKKNWRQIKKYLCSKYDKKII